MPRAGIRVAFWPPAVASLSACLAVIYAPRAVQAVGVQLGGTVGTLAGADAFVPGGPALTAALPGVPQGLAAGPQGLYAIVHNALYRVLDDGESQAV
jgi:hypothetical protein